MPATNYAINKSLDYDFGRIAYSGTSGCSPEFYYIGVSTTYIGPDETTITEPTNDTNYERIKFKNDKSNWTYAASGSIVNSTSASFVESSEAWGTLISVFLADGDINTSGSHVWFYYTLSPSIPVMANTVITFNAGTLSATRT